ncbi:hypothetical protein GBF35_41095 [Nonomuraea phyllanthi]|uniref:LuxR family transcriptional regulator n=1 Tax=Nonomuraea phyllanthi TaxID=2219224 RepID=UPI0012930F51|nr:LuxR family transcriptional regulator [Nonomuraea phyllanthi]QFY12127.1 hypothetical protein GBF35_41095 [Nonomuraea phyllanthi]
MDSADEELIAEAETAWRVGRAEAARRALDRAEGTTGRHTLPWLRIQALRGEIELRSGVPSDALAILTPPARQALNTHPAVALRMLLLAREAAFHCARQDAVDEVSALAAALPALAEPRLDALRGALQRYDTRPATAQRVAFRRGRIAGRQHMDTVADAAAGILELDDPDLLMAAGGMAFGIDRPALARQLRHRAATLARARGELGTLSTALDVLVPDHLSRAQYAHAQEHADEGRHLAERAGRDNTACSHLSYLTALAALRGDEDRARALGDSVLAAALPRRLLRPAGVVQYALGLMELAAGRLNEALTSFETLLGHTPQPGRPELAMTAAPDHIEAAVRAGHEDRVRDMAAAYIELADAAGTAEAGALAARCRALLGTEQGAETEFPRALQLHAEAERPFDHARTQLLYGEFLRRRRQRVPAREHLRAAERTFTHLGLPVWARRAAEELRAAGTTPRTRVAAEPLTPQERQIARAVAEGATNRQVAAKLFLSPRTVDYHLRKIFAKLGISSRAELIRNPPADPIQNS